MYCVWCVCHNVVHRIMCYASDHDDHTMVSVSTVMCRIHQLDDIITMDDTIV